MNPRKESKSGMTRKEVLVSLSLGLLVVFLLAGLVGNFISNARMNAGATRFLSNGRAIYMLIYTESEQFADTLASVAWLPDHTNPAHGNSSTDYFRHLMGDDVGILHQDLSLFICGETGMEAASSLGEFSAVYNAWAAVSGRNFETSPPTSPLFISRNLNESALQDWEGREDARLENVGRRAGTEGWRTPYDRYLVVVIHMHGGGDVLKGNNWLRWKHLNPHSETNVVLQP